MTNRELETRYIQMKLTWKNLVNANVELIDENKRLKEDIERLNNIIKKLERLVDDYAWNSYYFKCGNRYLKSEILNDIREIIELKGSDKE